MTMTDRLLTVEQYGLTALQMRERGPQTVVHPPYQNWMCPGCDKHHMHKGLFNYYRCSCGWEGDWHKLCRGEI